MQDTSWYNSTKEAEQDAVDTSLRPTDFDGFMGQSNIKHNLQVYIDAVKQRGDVLDHVFLSGPPGLGKTTLAYIISQALAVSIRITNAPAIEKPKDIIGILTTLQEGSVLFIDEIHRLKPIIEEILYVAMEDYMVDWVIGAGPDARAIRIPLHAFTLIGATTQPGKITAPLYSRFGIRERLDLYPEKDLTDIVLRTAQLLQVSITQEAAESISRISRGTPRYANRLLKRMRDFAQVKGEGIINADIISLGRKTLGIDERGLEEIDRRILRILVEDYRGKPVGLKTLAVVIGETPESLEDFWEVYLIKQGYLQRTPQGRQATYKTWQLFNLTPPAPLFDGSEPTPTDQQPRLW